MSGGVTLLWLSVLAIESLLLAILSYFTYHSGPLQMDRTFLEWYQRTFDSTAWEKSMEAVSWIGKDAVWAILLIAIAGIWWVLTKNKLVVALILGTVLAYGVNAVLKIIVDRPRPSADQVRVLQESESASFPSGHAASYLVLFGVTFFIATFYLKNRIIKLLLQTVLLALVLLVGPSRMTLGAHWPSDIAGGYLVGVLYLTLVAPVLLKLRRRED